MKIGLALSGGGIKGAAHIGIIKALHQNGITIDAIGGTSSGSIVAALYAMGYNVTEMLNVFEYFAKGIFQNSTKYILNSIRVKGGIDGTRSGESIELAVREAAIYKNVRTILDLKFPIVIPSVDIREGKKYVFTNLDIKDERYIKDIEIAKAVRASCSFPVVFAPFQYGRHQFMDGGILDGIPAQEVKKLGVDKVIAVKFKEVDDKKNNIYSIALRTIDIMSNAIADVELKYADYVLLTDTGVSNIFKVEKLRECYEKGYEAAIKNMIAIKKILT